MLGDPYDIAVQQARGGPRARVNIPATLGTSGGRKFRTVVHDLSLGGFCSSAIAPMAPNTVCWLTLPGLEAQQSRVIWWEASLVGCTFEALLSQTVLDNLVGRWCPVRVLRSAA